MNGKYAYFQPRNQRRGMPLSRTVSFPRNDRDMKDRHVHSFNLRSAAYEH